MGSQQKPNSMDRVGTNVAVVESSKRVRYCDATLRILGLLLTFVAAIVTGLDKETKMVTVTVVKTLPPVRVPVFAKWQYMSASVYLLVANVITCSYAAATLILSMAAGWSFKDNKALALIILDLMMTDLLFSANGAAISVGLIGQKGNSHVHWIKVCNIFEGFCHRMTVAVISSLLGSFAFLWLVALAILNLHKRSKEMVDKGPNAMERY